MQTKIAVLGAGSWGTALAANLIAGGHDVVLWARCLESAQAMAMNRRNPKYLKHFVLPDTLGVTSNLAEATRNASLWVMATPSHGVRPLSLVAKEYAHADLFIVCVAKGIERETGFTMTQVLSDTLSPPVPVEHIAALYGPSHAEELAAGKPTTVVAAAPSLNTAMHIQRTFMTGTLRVYVNEDVFGVQIAGSIKNIIAIAAGISDGIGYGDNAKAALITRGLAEIQRMGVALGAKAETFAGLTGLGDLVVTCTSSHSRNRQLGEEIGRGRTLGDVIASMNMVAEGVETTIAIRAIALEHGIDMPITESVHGILFEGKQPLDAVRELMTRSAKQEEWLRV